MAFCHRVSNLVTTKQTKGMVDLQQPWVVWVRSYVFQFWFRKELKSYFSEIYFTYSNLLNVTSLYSPSPSSRLPSLNIRIKMVISSTASDSLTRELIDPSEVMTYFLTGMSTEERKRHRARSIKFPLKVCRQPQSTKRTWVFLFEAVHKGYFWLIRNGVFINFQSTSCSLCTY